MGHLHGTMVFTIRWFSNTLVITIQKKAYVSDLMFSLLFTRSVMSNSVTPWTAARDFPVLHFLSEFAQTHVHWVGDAIWPLHPLLPPSHPALNLSQHQGLFQRVGSSHLAAKVWSSSFSISPSSEYSRLISFRIDWFDLQGTLKGLSRVFSSTTCLWRPMDLKGISNQSTSLFFKWGQWSWERLDDFSKVATSQAQQHPNLQTAVTVLTATLSSMP